METKADNRFIIAGAVLGALALAGVVAALVISIQMVSFQRQIKSMVIDPVDIGKVADGIYIDSCQAVLVAAVVKVDVSGGKIVNIKKVSAHIIRSRKYNADTLLAVIIQKQSLSLDAISGATGSSKVLLKSVEKALKQGLN